MRRLTWIVPCLLLCAPAAAKPLRFEVRVGAGLAGAPLDGRLFVILAPDATPEPREQVGGGDATAQIFGVDVDGWAQGKAAAIEGTTLGYPVPSLAQVPPGDYHVRRSTSTPTPTPTTPRGRSAARRASPPAPTTA